MNFNKHSKQRQELLEWFQKEAKPLSQAYEGAIELIQDRDRSGRVNFIAHAVRDICNRLVFVLDPQSEPQRVDYDGEMDRIEKLWPPSIQNDLKTSVDPIQTISIPVDIAKQMNALIDNHRRRRQTPSNSKRLLKFLMHNEPTQAHVNQRIIKDFEGIQDWFMARAHFPSKEVPQTGESELQMQFNKFEGILHSFVGSFFTVIEILDEILKEDRCDQLKKVISLLSSPQHEVYFFKKLQNPSWIGPLRDEGFFDSPHKVESAGNWGVRYPPWPPAVYLARMASQAPSEVVDIFASLDTNNPSIIRNMIDAALKIPVELSIKLVEATCKAAEVGALLLCLDEASDFCAKLALEGKGDAAKQLADSLFTPKFIGKRIDPHYEYWYQESLKKIVPILASQKRPNKFLYGLCDWLKAYVVARDNADPETGADHSWFWRPAIAEHRENQNHNPESILVGFVREAFEIAIKTKHISLEKALAIIAKDQYPYLIFKRIHLHLINEFAEINPNLARQAIMNNSLFRSYEYKHEYALLVGKRFNLLCPNDQSIWFGWLEMKPTEDELPNIDSEKNESNQQSRVQYWKFKKLHLIRDHLIDEQKKLYDEMVKKYGWPELADINIQSESGCLSNESPLSVSELSEMTFPVAVERVSSWEPKKAIFLGPNVEALSSIFQKFVATRAVEYSSQADILIDRPAIYVRKFIEQMTQEIKIGSAIEIAPLLKLCLWVIKQPVEKRTTLFEEYEGMVDPDWQWTRDSIAQLTREICQSIINDVPKYPLEDLRRLLWQLIESLYNKQSKSQISRNKSEGNPRTEDFIEVGINSSKGKAIEAALAYARWVSNHIKISEGLDKPLSNGFELIPEVRELLENELSSEDRTSGTLAIIGFHINLIYWIDKKWLAVHAAQLFPLTTNYDIKPNELEWAAWNAFLVWTPPHIQFYKLFKNQFALAVEHSKGEELSKNGNPNPMNHLGEHLMILYLRGEFGFANEEKDLLNKFLSTSKSDTRRHAIHFVGAILDRNQSISVDAIIRAQKLWEEYWSGMGKVDSQEKPSKWPFDAWFSSGKLPLEWSLAQFEEYLACTKSPEPSNEVVEQLAHIFVIDPARVLNILNIIIRADKEGWRINGWLKSIKSILEDSMKAGGNIYESARQLINYLARAGYTELT